jgi:hypothetical protein
MEDANQFSATLPPTTAAVVSEQRATIGVPPAAQLAPNSCGNGPTLICSSACKE